MVEEYARIQDMQRRIDQLAVEPWRTETELVCAYEYLFAAYDRFGVEQLDPVHIGYLVDGQRYQKAQSDAVLSAYQEAAELEPWEETYLGLLLDR